MKLLGSCKVDGGGVKKDLHDWEADLVSSAGEVTIGVNGYHHQISGEFSQGKCNESLPNGIFPNRHVA